MEGRERFYGAESVCGDRERTKHEHPLKRDLTPLRPRLLPGRFRFAHRAFAAPESFAFVIQHPSTYTRLGLTLTTSG
jgi:hypothetical protein